MLVLTRRSGESIRIGDQISVSVLDIQKGQVRIAIEAPREIPVHRQEVYEQVKAANRTAADVDRGTDPGELWRRRRGDS